MNNKNIIFSIIVAGLTTSAVVTSPTEQFLSIFTELCPEALHSEDPYLYEALMRERGQDMCVTQEKTDEDYLLLNSVLEDVKEVLESDITVSDSDTDYNSDTSSDDFCPETCGTKVYRRKHISKRNETVDLSYGRVEPMIRDKIEEYKANLQRK